MAANEVAVVAKLQDQVSPGLRAMGAGLVRFGKTAMGSMAGLAKAALSVRTALVGVGAYVGAKLGSDLVNATADSQTALLTLARQANVTAESLTAMGYAASMSGTSTEDLKQAILTLRNKMGDALRGTKAQVEVFNRLGISVHEIADGKLDLVDFFGRVADGLKGVGTEAERSRLLVDLFGESAAVKLMPMLDQGAIGLQRLAGEASDFGRVFGESSLKVSESFVQAKRKLGESIKGLRDQFFGELYPALTEVFTKIAETIATHRTEILEAFKSIALGLVDVAAALPKAFGLVNNLFDVELNHTLIRLRDDREALEETLAGLEKSQAAYGEKANTKFQEQGTWPDDLVERSRRYVAAREDLVKQIAEIRAEENRLTEGPAVRGLMDLRKQIAGIKFGGTAASKGGEEQGPQEEMRPGEAYTYAPEQVMSGWQKVGEGIKTGMKAYVESIGSMQQMAAQAAQNFASGFGDIVTDGFMGIIDGSMKAKDAFKQMALDMLKMIARLIVQFAVLNAVKAGIGGLFGVSLPGAGAASGPAMAAGGGGGPADFGGGTSGGGRFVSGPTNVNVTIQALDGASVEQLLYQKRNVFVGCIAEAMKTNRSFRLAMQG